MKEENSEYLSTKIRRSQDRYVHSQIDLFDRILAQVEKQYEHSLGQQTINGIAATIYQGYILSDIEDAIRNGQLE
ncbi:hypothetical protein KJW57_00225 [Streptococcus lutetiensis]|uniref:hypothetical protein n=1 Tax=Streptococcus lutetiensis TaxID=150055 RepID=UPI001BD9F29B|nr:hypothetical protein [Streptococcus lutetiensis]MBT0897667.1 hypothetical protein [Streptococcus lutetiensis]MBT1056418.1 hypothetical protein [Streptococcus lutetiensis]MBT1058174.1 hypothetical protein [Streptococcus lutetiensis]